MSIPLVRRRDLLIGLTAAASFARRGRAQDAGRRAALDRISVMSGCFGSMMTEVRDWSREAAPKQLDIMAFPELLADRYGLHHVEVQQIHFLSMKPSYYEEFNRRLAKAKSKMVNMPLELDDQGYQGLVSPCSPDPALRARAVEQASRWIDIAAMIECPNVMINQGMAAFPADMAPSIDALKTLSAYGKSKNVAVLMENRGKATPEELAQLIRATGTYANPDTGNFRDEETRARGLRVLYPLSHNFCHVKLNARFDFANTIRISKEMGFQGVYSVETGGPDPYAAVQKVVDALVENL
jgi:hypothetical protein